MKFGLSPEQTLLNDSLAAFLKDTAPLARVREIADARDGRPHDLMAGLAALGIPALLVPEAYGGAGLKPLDACLVAETLGYHVAPAPYVSSTVVAPTALMLAGSEAQKQAWLPRIAAGEVVVGAALTEIASGARHGAGVTSSGGKLDGRALFVLDFAADAYLVADARRGLHLVDARAAGLTRKPLETVDRTRTVGELLLEGVAAEPLAAGGAGATDRVLDVGRAVLAADALGAAQCMIDQAVAYAHQREQFGRVIGSFQAVKHMCAEMAADLEPVRASVWYAGHALGEDLADAHVAVCHLKAHMGEVGKRIAKTATEVHGGMGFTDLVGLHYWFKRIGFDRQLLGSPERLRMEAARAQGLVA